MDFIRSLLQLAIIIVVIAGIWQVFTKAGKPGWACLIPIYNIVVLLQIVEKPIWWIILMFIPLVNLVIAFLLQMAMAEKFGKGIGVAVGLFFLPFIFYPWLGFGDASYRG